MIESLEEAETTLLRERAAEARRNFHAAVRPIYAVVGQGRNPKMQHIGSCILLSVDGQRILSTAGHILDIQSRSASLFVGGRVGTRPMPIIGGLVRTTSAPQGDRQKDILDSGFWRIPDDAIGDLGAVEFLDESWFSHNRVATDHRYYTAMGYRVARNKSAVDHRKKAIETRGSSFTGRLMEIPESARKLGFSSERHLFLRFEDLLEDEDGKQANAFGPKGFSGGALLDLGNFTPAQVCASAKTWRATLSGMLIEHKRDYKALVAVQIGSIVDGIRNVLRSGITT